MGYVAVNDRDSDSASQNDALDMIQWFAFEWWCLGGREPRLPGWPGSLGCNGQRQRF